LICVRCCSVISWFNILMKQSIAIQIYTRVD
jgi:hypothetical protein